MGNSEDIPLRAIQDHGHAVQRTPSDAFTSTEEVNAVSCPSDSIAFVEPEEVDANTYAGLRKLDYRPVMLEDWVLILSFLLNVGWIVVLALALFIDPRRPLQGPPFILDGLFGGYVASFAKFIASSQNMALCQIMPFCSMASESKSEVQGQSDRQGSRTLLTDYYPYDWPIPRLRPALNGHWFLFAVDLATFVSSYAVVQFASNILTETSDSDNEDSVGWVPNLGIIYVVIACHSTFTTISLVMIFWLKRYKKTGLAARPGSIAMLLAMLKDSRLEDDFNGLDLGAHGWEVRRRLGHNEYKIAYWENPSGDPLYGIRRVNKQSRVQEHDGSTSRTWPRFSFVPWFVRPYWMMFWAVLLASALSIALTLFINEDILDNGFEPHASTDPLPILLFSNAGFLWSFFPSLAADQFRLLCKNMDMFYRVVQPYRDLQCSREEPNLRALTINYVKDLPVIVTLKAGLNGHWQVAIASALSFISSFIPALAANIFYADSYYQRIFIQERPFILTLTFMGLLLVALVILTPDERSHLPHDLETLADHISFLYKSNLTNLDELKFEISPRVAKGSVSLNDETTKGGSCIQLTRAVLQPLKSMWKQVREIKWKPIAKSCCPWIEPDYEREAQKRLASRTRNRQEGHEAPFQIGFGVLSHDNDSPAVSLSTGNCVKSLYGENELKTHFWRKAKDFVL